MVSDTTEEMTALSNGGLTGVAGWREEMKYKPPKRISNRQAKPANKTELAFLGLRGAEASGWVLVAVSISRKG
ncbi:hypothetical protein GCM10023183_27720 [Nibribacter koreensis]|uniref:Uncharacterized protein n=1 Tax=Nibribacter koreensis TaxID=1084519 RepID=A0ABP8FSL4_9BACT